MTAAEFATKYKLGNLLAAEGANSFLAQNARTRRVVMVHRFDSVTPDEDKWIRTLLATRRTQDPRLVLDELDVDGVPVIVTQFMLDFTGLRTWLEHALTEQGISLPPGPARAAPRAAETPATSPEVDGFTELFGAPVPLANASMPPASHSAPPPNEPRSAPVPASATFPPPPPARPAPASATLPPAAAPPPPADGEFTHLFGALPPVEGVPGATLPPPSAAPGPPARPPEPPPPPVRQPPAAAPVPAGGAATGAMPPMPAPSAGAPGDFTQLFGAVPGQPRLGSDAKLGSEPPRPLPPPIRAATAPPPAPPSAPPHAPSEISGAGAALPPVVPARPADEAAMPAPGDFTKLFGALPTPHGGPTTGPVPPVAPPPRGAQPIPPRPVDMPPAPPLRAPTPPAARPVGANPPPIQSSEPGEFTRAFQGHVPPAPPRPATAPAQLGAPEFRNEPPRAPAPPPPAAPQSAPGAGDFTRIFQGGSTVPPESDSSPRSMPPMLPDERIGASGRAPDPLMPPPLDAPRRPEPTWPSANPAPAVGATESMRRMTQPPPPPAARGLAPRNVTPPGHSPFSTGGNPPVPLAPPVFRAPGAVPNEGPQQVPFAPIAPPVVQGGSDFTRLLTPLAAPSAAPAPPPIKPLVPLEAAKKTSWLPLIITVNVVLLLGIALVLYFLLGRK